MHQRVDDVHSEDEKRRDLTFVSRSFPQLLVFANPQLSSFLLRWHESKVPIRPLYQRNKGSSADGGKGERHLWLSCPMGPSLANIFMEIR